MPLRKLFFWIHLAAGVLAGVVILAMSVTGVLLAFERQIVGWAERDLRATSSEAAGRPLPVSAILAAAVAASPDAKPSNVILRSDSHAPVTVAFGRERTLFVNRYSGAVLGEGAKGVRGFFQVNEDVHRWLALKGETREVGKKITGVSNAIFLFIVLSGLYIWIPKRKTRAAFGNLAFFRRGLRGRARDFNWHHVLGLWAFLPLVLIVFSGMVISYPWASALVYRAFGDEPPKPQNNERERGGGRQARGGDRGAERDDDHVLLTREMLAAPPVPAAAARRKPPPCIHTVTGRLPEACGVQTFRTRQSSSVRNRRGDRAVMKRSRCVPRRIGVVRGIEERKDHLPGLRTERDSLAHARPWLACLAAARSAARRPVASRRGYP